LPKDIRQEAVECKSMNREGLLEVRLKKDIDMMRISEIVHRPILTYDYKEYWILDGNVANTYSVT